MTRSLRLRLFLGTSIASVLILGLLCVSIFIAMRRTLVNEFDSALLTSANSLAAMAEQNGHTVIFEADYLTMDEFTRSKTPDFFSVQIEDGKVLASSPSLNGRALNPDVPADAPVYRDRRLPNGRGGRSITISFVPRYEPDEGPRLPYDARSMQSATLILARDTGTVEATVARMRMLLLGICGLAILLSEMVLLVIVSRAMKPVRRLAGEIESLRETELSTRLACKDVPAELTPVVERLNELLGRLQQAFARERAFTADVAHELRTPLAGLQTILQVTRSRPRDRVEYEAIIDKCLKINLAMHGTIESLLLLARADAGQLPIHRKQVDLAALIGECRVPFESRAAERGVRFENHLFSIVSIETDPEKLRIILNNLFDNAVTYCPSNGTIRLEASTCANGAVIRISNTVPPDFRAQDIGRLFDTFWRGDSARSQTGVHCGLGLSICRRLIELLGGSISAEIRDGFFSIKVFVRGDAATNGQA
jgi:two-component system sensor histidine kinase QseC